MQRMRVEITKFINKYWKAWVLAGIVTVISFGYMLGNPVLTIDEETWVLTEGGLLTWLLQGRFGIEFLNFFLTDNGRFVPFFSEVISLILWSASGIGFAYFLWHKDEKITGFHYFIFLTYFNTLPFVIGESMSFSQMTIQEYIGMLAAVLAFGITLQLTDGMKKRKVAAVLLLLVFAFSTYQAVVGVYASAIVAICLIRFLKHENCGRIIFLGILFSGVAVGLYFIIDKVIGMVIGTADYLSGGYIGWSQGIGYSLFMSLANVIRVSFAVPISDVYIYGGGVIRTVTIIFILYSIWKFAKEKEMKRKFGVLFFTVALVVSPFFLYIVLGTYKTVGRMLLPLSLVGAVELVLILRDMEKGWLKKAAWVLASFLILANVYNMNKIYYYQHLVNEYDCKTADQVMYDIEAAGLDYHTKPVVFIGMRTMDELPIETSGTLGGSFFSWDDGNIVRMDDFIRTRGHQLLEPSNEQILEALEYKDEMLCWPQEGGIKETQQLIIVKFSEPTQRWYTTNRANEFTTTN